MVAMVGNDDFAGGGCGGLEDDGFLVRLHMMALMLKRVEMTKVTMLSNSMSR